VTAFGGTVVVFAVLVGINLYSASLAGFVSHKKCLTKNAALSALAQVTVVTCGAMEVSVALLIM